MTSRRRPATRSRAKPRDVLADILEREAASARNLAWVEEMRKRDQQILKATSTRDLIRESWRERDRAVLDAVGLPDVSVAE
ncbi:MAG TPA: hypothetical protein VNT53_07950 [Pseudolysinimonas sp.]|nr:hypothetical protein [Pseudolysinimonas sp.]